MKTQNIRLMFLALMGVFALSSSPVAHGGIVDNLKSSTYIPPSPPHKQEVVNAVRG